MSIFGDSLDEYGAAVWTVSELSAYVRQMFELDYRLQDVDVSGEISNFRRAASGHLYFTLKDQGAQIKCVMWRSQAERLVISPSEGDAVLAHGRLSVYEAGGVYQLYVDHLMPAGRGDLALAFERLKEQLAAEGLFDTEIKQAIPAFPHKIGIVTSPDAAALRDILKVLKRRHPLLSVLIAPTLVQGDAAPSGIVRALKWLDSRDDIDVIIVARGGGSIEDLWAFNEERVVRAIFSAGHPVISGIGHETDFTIADFVADQRAPTPSAAAELVAPDLTDIPSYLKAQYDRLRLGIEETIAGQRSLIDNQRQLLGLVSPRARIDDRQQLVDHLAGRLAQASRREFEQRRSLLAVAETGLKTVSPMATLSRGFAIVRDSHGHTVSRSSEVAAGDQVTVQLSDGSFDAEVTSVDPAQS